MDYLFYGLGLSASAYTIYKAIMVRLHRPYRYHANNKLIKQERSFAAYMINEQNRINSLINEKYFVIADEHIDIIQLSGFIHDSNFDNEQFMRFVIKNKKAIEDLTEEISLEYKSNLLTKQQTESHLARLKSMLETNHKLLNESINRKYGITKK